MNVRQRAWAAPSKRNLAGMSPSLTRLGFLIRHRSWRRRLLKHLRGVGKPGRSGERLEVVDRDVESLVEVVVPADDRLLLRLHLFEFLLFFVLGGLALVPLLLFWTGLRHGGYLCCWGGRGQNHSHRG